MTSESQAQPKVATTPPRAGWYRDPETGRRRLWNGSRWLDLADTVTPFTVESDPEPDPAAEEPDTGPADRPTGVLVMAAGVILVALIVLVALGVGVRSGPGQPTIPSLATGTSPHGSGSASAQGGSATTTGGTTATTASGGGTASAASLGTGSTGSGSTGSGSTGSGPGASSTSIAPVGGTGSTAGSTPAPAVAPAAGRRQPVTVVGDSITALAQHQIQRDLSHQFRTAVHAYGGTTISNWLSLITSTVHTEPPHDWVVELGTNDVLDGTATWQSDFLQEVLELSGQSCVVLVTVNPRLGPAATALNQAMANVASTQPAFHILDWGDIEFDQPEWVRPDGVHPTKAGSGELARIEHDALLSDC